MKCQSYVFVWIECTTLPSRHPAVVNSQDYASVLLEGLLNESCSWSRSY